MKFKIMLFCIMLAGCAGIQEDLTKLQADIQTHKVELIPKLQAGIAYADAVGDVEWATCQRGLLEIAQMPSAALPDLTNPFIKLEVARQINQAVQGGIGQSELIHKINMACAPWYMRERVEILKIAARVGSMLH